MHIDDLLNPDWLPDLSNLDWLPDGLAPYLEKIIALVVCLVVAIIIIDIAAHLVKFIIQCVRKSAVRREYHVKVPHSIHIKRSRNKQQIGTFTLDYPAWEDSKKDGTRDRRTNNMGINKYPSILELQHWRFSGTDPFVFYDFVNELRMAGVEIGYCPEEQYKRRKRALSAQSHRHANTIDHVIAQFQHRYTDFEQFCASMFRALGYQASVTPPTNDGGLDIRLVCPDGATAIVECKCYARNNHVGRPVIQKLHGANAVEHADRMVVVTTSSFTTEAVTFAQQVDVELIDGGRLIQLCKRAWGDSMESAPMPETLTTLTRQDIMAHIPADMRSMY